MEGNESVADCVLPKYIKITTALCASKDKHGLMYPELALAIDRMIKEIESYQTKALECDAIIVATAMHPRYCLQFFTKYFPHLVKHAHNLVEQAYEAKLACMPKKNSAPAAACATTDSAAIHQDHLDDFSEDSGDDTTADTRVDLKKYLDSKSITPKGALPDQDYKEAIAKVQKVKAQKALKRTKKP